MKTYLTVFMIVWGVSLCGSWPIVAQEAQDDPYAETIHDLIQDMPPQTAELDHPALQEGPHRLQLHVVSSATGEELRRFQVSLYPRTATRFGPGRLREVVWPSWKTYHDVVGVASLDGLSEDRWFLMIYSPGYVWYGQGVTVPHEEVLEIALVPKTARLSGRVVDAVTHTPLAGATVRMSYLIGASEGVDGVEEPDFHPVTTGADGTFRIEPLPGADYETRLEISHDGYSRERRTLAATAPWKETIGDILLYPHGRIDGQVLDGAGQPVQGQMVYVLHEEVPYQDVRAVARMLAGKYPENPPKAMLYRTAADGRFRTIPIPGGRYRIVYGNLDRHVRLIGLEYGEKKTLRLEKR